MSNATSQTWEPPANGIVGGYTGDNLNILRAMTAFAAIAWYNCAELFFLIPLRFKHCNTLYFWSLMGTNTAVLIYQIGAWCNMNNITASLLTQTFQNLGWIFMVGGNSIVLYSRLHLLTQRTLLLRFVLWGVIINTVLMYIPTTTLAYGTNRHPQDSRYFNGYQIMERIQMTLFSVQEFAISGLYVLEASKYLRMVYAKDTRTKRVMYELLAVNIALIVLDIGLLSVEYENLYQVEVTLKGLVYSVKLKLELGVLSRLVKVVTKGHGLHRTATFATDAAEKGSTVAIERVETNRTSRTASTLPRPFFTHNPFDRTRSNDSSPPLSPDFVTSAIITGANSEVNQQLAQELRDEGLDGHVGMSISSQGNSHPRLSDQFRPQQQLPEYNEPQPMKMSRESSIGDLYPGKIQG